MLPMLAVPVILAEVATILPTNVVEINAPFAKLAENAVLLCSG